MTRTPAGGAAGERAPRRVSVLKQLMTPKAEIPDEIGLAAGFVLWLAFLGLWALITYGRIVPAIFLPTPGAVAVRAVEMAADGSLALNIWASAQVVLLGFALSTIVAIPLGIAMGAFRIA